MLFASASCAVIVTAAPATGPELEEVTRYFVAVPGIVVIVDVVPAFPPVVPVTVVAVPDTVCVVNDTVATPLAFVVEVEAPKEPLASDFVQVTT